MKITKLTYFFTGACLLLLLPFGAFAQIEYTDCQNAFNILDPIDWCSGDAVFSNTAVGASGYGAATCWDTGDDDIWFEFQAFATAVNIVVDGQGNGNTLGSPQIALYFGTCGGVINELECASSNGITNLFETGLIIGQTYLIRINGEDNDMGDFGLCINNYNPPSEPGQDCVTGAVLCDKSPFVVQAVTGAGANPDEAAGSCLGNNGQNSENQSTWFKWTAANNGTLTFTISPLNTSDDLDFVLYEIPDVETCSLTELRCMATACSGPTGLNMESTDLEEDLNCDSGEDGFVRFIDMVAGTSYALIVNNFSNTGVGFNMEWGGTGEFLGPDPEFEIIPESGLACDQAFEIVNLSTSPTGIDIISYNWNFGERAIPASSTLENPGPVMYEKFGEKFIVLEVETDKGCLVTEVLPLTAEPCCDDLFDIEVDAIEVIDLSCPGVPDGSFTLEGSGGNPEYEFAINNSGEFSEQATYNNLFAGIYKVNVIDIKGCQDSILLTLDEPSPVTPDAGPDQETTLGFNADLMGSWDPPGENVIISWSSIPVDSTMSCYDCPTPTVTPPGTTTYYMQITDENGCVSVDSVVVRVKLERPIYSPNVFSPNGDGINEIFTVFTNRAAHQINVLRIYDRWGNKVYEGENLPINDPTIGWNGRFNDRTVQSGVYGWYAEILFIDNIIVDFKGDVTVIR